MSMFVFTATPDVGEPVVIRADSRDVLVWERVAKGRSMNALMENMRVSDMYEIAHVAARRQQMFEGPLPDFERDYALDIEQDDDADDEGPEVPTTAAR